MDKDSTILSLADLELPKLEAVLELMFLAAYSDGTVTPPERAVFRDHLTSSTRGALSAETIDLMIEQIGTSLLEDGRERRLESIRKRLSDERLRMSALDIVIRVMRADDVVHPTESGFLLRAAAALEIPADVALERLRLSYASHG